MNFRGAGLILLSPDYQVLLVQDRKTLKWGFPKGHREPEDTCEVATAQREVHEEIGLEPSAYTLHPLSFRIIRGTSSYLFRYAFLNQAIWETPLQLQREEITGHLWVPLPLFYLNPDVVDGNKYLRTWIQDVTTGAPRKAYTILRDILSYNGDAPTGTPLLGVGGAGTLFVEKSLRRTEGLADSTVGVGVGVGAEDP